MKTISWYKKDTLHIETELGIVNIRPGLIDMYGRKVTSIEIIPDKYAGEPIVRLRGISNNRLVQIKTKNKKGNK